MNPSIWMAATGAVLCLLPASRGGGDERDTALSVGQGKELRILRVADLSAPFTTDPLPSIGLTLRQTGAEDTWLAGYPPAKSLFDLPTARPMQLDRVAELVRVRDPQTWETEGSMVAVYHGKLFVTNEPAVLDRAEAHLTAIKRTIVPRLALRCVVFEDRAGATPTGMQHLDLAEAQRLFAAASSGKHGPVLYAGDAQGRPGDRMFLGQRRSVGLQSDISVEVAQDAKIAEPNISAIELGNGLACMSLVRPDGQGLALFGLFSWRDLGVEGVHAQDIVAAPLSHLEVADVDQAQLAFCATIGAEGACLLSPGGIERPNLRLLLVVDRLDPMPEAVQGAAIVPAGLTTSAAFRSFRIRDPFDESPEGGIGIRMDDRVGPEPLVDLGVMLSGRDTPGIEVAATPFLVAIRGSAERVPIAARIVRTAMQDSDRSFVVELTREIKPIDAGGDAWQRDGAPIVVPVLGDRAGYALQGSERSYIADFSVEIAQEASIADPEVRSCFDGVQVIAGVEPQGGDECRVSVLLLDRALQELRRVAPAAEHIGAIWCPEQTEIRLQRGLTMKPGDSVQLGQGPRRRVGTAVHDTRWSVRLLETRM